MPKQHTPKPCRDCGVERPDAHPRSVYCRSCAERRIKESHAQSAKRRKLARQAQMFFACCRNCGTRIAETGKSPRCAKYCAPCAIERKRQTAREFSAAKLRAAGVGPIKGTTAQCFICLDGFIRKGVNDKYCPSCRELVPLERAKARGDRKRRAAGVTPLGTLIACSRCGSDTPRKSGRSKYCPNCAKIVAAELRPVQVRAYKQKHGLSPVARSYQRKSPEQRAAENRAKRERRKARNPQALALNDRMSVNIRQSLRRQGVSKSGRRWEAMVGYTTAELREHLERQFLPGMTWANMGLWHIDHIEPLAGFTFSSADDPEFRRAWSLANLRPLWAEMNMVKGARTGAAVVRLFAMRGYDPAHAHPRRCQEAAA